ncbi:hypothetical protein EDB81DRAFT_934639, partial [Dactylonectria macrodidyma]
MSESADSERERPVPARRSHTKSRKGCQECKKRKVKVTLYDSRNPCDEKPPSCFNCSRRGVVCSLQRTSTVSPGPRQLKSTTLDLLASHWQSAPFISETWGRGLELMHHYTSITAKTLALRPSMQHTWHHVVPQIAYRSPFLMHGIIAAAALHKAHLLPISSREYVRLAFYHETAGLEGFRAGLQTLEYQDWKPYFCFSSIVVLCMSWQPSRILIELPLAHADDGESVPGVLDLLVFIRGIRTVLQPYELQIVSSTLAPLVEASWSHLADAGIPPDLANSTIPHDSFEAVARLQDFYRKKLVGNMREGFLSATDELLKSFHHMASAGTQPELGMVMTIPYAIHDDVLAEILALKPHGMVFVAYLAGLFRVLEAHFWFLEGLPRRLFEVIDINLAKFPLHREMVRWPREKMFDIY